MRVAVMILSLILGAIMALQTTLVYGLSFLSGDPLGVPMEQ